jgi:diguanylate cyclase (GGDEF)-like protein/PAS domain S-box-containing protein
VKIVDDDTIDGYAAMPDIYGRPALTFNISLHRDMYRYGQSTIYYFLMWLLIIVGAFAAIVHLGLKKLARSRAEQRAIEARYGAVIAQSAEGILLVDMESRQVLDANPAMCALLGYSADEIVALHLRDVLGCGAGEADAYLRQAAADRRHATRAMHYQRKDRSLVEVEAGANVVRHDDKEVLCIVALDVTERRQAQEQIEYLAHFDALTGLPNRALLGDRLRQILAQSRRDGAMAAVILMNLDRFKIVNESLGPHFGDLLLRSVAQRLRDTVRAGDTVARHGGDEYVVIMGGLRLVQDCLTVGDKILEALAQAVEVDGQELHVTASIGISLYPNDGDDVETLLKKADIAMDNVKGEGGNAYRLYASTMNVRSFERLTIENSLRHALEREELSLHYQPQVDLSSGRVYGMEALLRWNHPKLGNVSPLKFIPVAEETGLIISIGEWVLRTACYQTQEWQARGFPPLRVAVNLSVRQFAQKNLAQMIAEILDETGLPAHCLDVELTESMLMDNVADNIKVLRELKDRGLTISVDDFGTGYSSLSYLQRMPIDTMKIDRSFVRDISGPDSDAPIAKAIIALAHSLRMETIAEGVETRAQREFMHAHGCDALQGFYFSQPLAVPDFTALLEQGRTLFDVEAAADGEFKMAN